MIQQSARCLDRGSRQCDTGWFFIVLEGFLRLIVIGTNAIRDTPMGHCTGRIRSQRLLKTLNRFLMIVPVGPSQSTVTPFLSRRDVVETVREYVPKS